MNIRAKINKIDKNTKETVDLTKFGHLKSSIKSY